MAAEGQGRIRYHGIGAEVSGSESCNAKSTPIRSNENRVSSLAMTVLESAVTAPQASVGSPMAPPSLAATTPSSAASPSSSTSDSVSTLPPVPRIENDREASSPIVVLESLLALAKDQRYQQECQRLVREALDVVVAGSSGSSTTTTTTATTTIGTRRELPVADAPIPTYKLVSVAVSSLWMTWIVWRHGKTLGMEACGLDFASGPWRVRSATLLSVLAQCCLLCGPPSALDASRGIDGGHSAAALLVDSATGTRRPAESLRGSQRRQFHEAQRRAMVERSSSRQHHASPPLQPQSTAATGEAAVGTTRRSIARLVWRVMRSVAATSVANVLGPHDVSDPNRPISALTAYTVGTWLLRLHLAFYCLQGRFPSWFHRVFRLPLRSHRDALVHRPSHTPRIVGLLILAQAFGAGVPAVARLVLRNGWGPRLPQGRAASSTSDWRRIFASDPMAAAPRPSPSSPAPPCLICRQPRVRPACPPCGHVFCWTCLHHWLSAGPRRHCPYCRAPCRPQQVLALHHY